MMGLDSFSRLLALLLIIMASITKIFTSSPLDVPSERIYQMVYSYDHTRIAYVKVNYKGQSELYVANANRSDGRVIFTDTYDYGNAIGIGDISWSPNGKQLLFALWYLDQQAHGFAVSEIRTINADGSGSHILVHKQHWVFAPIWLLDGKHIAFGEGMGGCNATYIVDLNGTNPQYVVGCIGTG